MKGIWFYNEHNRRRRVKFKWAEDKPEFNKVVRRGSERNIWSIKAYLWNWNEERLGEDSNLEKVWEGHD